MGSDKFDLGVAGEPLWRRQAAVLRAAGAERVALVRRPGQATPEGAICWRDLYSGAGPLAGLHAALARLTEPWMAVLAVDMPGIDAGWFRWLAGFCRPGVGAMARHAEACEPLAAIYPRGALPEVTARLQRKDLSLQRLASSLARTGRLRLVPLPTAMRGRVRSLNTPEQLRAFI